MIGAVDRVFATSVRWFFRRRQTRRQSLVDRLTHDPKVVEAVEAEAIASGTPRAVMMARAERYAHEIVPSLSLTTYLDSSLASLSYTVGEWASVGLLQCYCHAGRLILENAVRREETPMLSFADLAIAVALVVVHAGLLVWAMVGFAELVWAAPPWSRISNPLFSSEMLLLQWSVVAAAALTFLVGYAGRWVHLREAMVAWYVVMAAICAWQTFFILVHPSRFAQMALEYAEYLAIAIYLYFSPHIGERLNG